MREPLISIILPVYNGAYFIEKALVSIANQTYKNIECIIIDDCSTDNTADIISSFDMMNGKLKYIKQPVNKGVSAARNTGLSYAKGEYIFFMDADDKLQKFSIEKLISKAVSDDSDLVIGVHKEFDSKSTSLPHYYTSLIDLNISKLNNNFFYLLINHVYVFGKLYRTQLVKGFRFDEKLIYAEDQLLALHSYINANNISFIPEVIYYYRKHNFQSASNLSITYPEKYINSILISLNTGIEHIQNSIYRDNTNILNAYVSRVLLGSIKYIFERSLVNKKSDLSAVFITLEKWTLKLNSLYYSIYYYLKLLFVDNGHIYMTYLNSKEQRAFIEFIKVIKMKLTESQKETDNKNNKMNEFYRMLLQDTSSEDYQVPFINHWNSSELTVSYKKQTLQDHKYVTKYKYINQNWIAFDSHEEKVDKMNDININIKKQSTIVLTYEHINGSNTYHLYKHLYPQLKEKADIQLIYGRSKNFRKQIRTGDIIINGNMEYGINYSKARPRLLMNLWHGFPLKNMFFTDNKFNNYNTISPFWSQYDILTSYSNLYNEIVNKTIRINPSNYVVTGSPRNDAMLNGTDRNKLFKLLNKKDRDQKTIFYMPTFRNYLTDKKLENFNMNYFHHGEFNEFLSKNNIELIMINHNHSSEFANNNSNITSLNNIDFLKAEIDLYEVLGASDLLITDYSSVYFDYLLLNKPIIFVNNDLQEYNLNRGLMFDYDSMTPGVKVKKQDELQSEIINNLNNKGIWEKKRQVISSNVHHYKDNLSSSRVLDVIKDYL